MAGIAVPHISFVMTAARAQRPRPTRMAIRFRRDVPAIEKRLALVMIQTRVYIS
jgi:hypothetical protein